MMISWCSGTSLKLTVERGDHIVPSFQEISGRTTNPQTQDTSSHKRHSIKIFATHFVDNPVFRELTGRAYYTAAMQSHGLTGKIPTSFTTGLLSLSSLVRPYISLYSRQAILREHPVQLSHTDIRREHRGRDGENHEQLPGCWGEGGGDGLQHQQHGLVRQECHHFQPGLQERQGRLMEQHVDFRCITPHTQKEYEILEIHFLESSLECYRRRHLE